MLATYEKEKRYVSAVYEVLIIKQKFYFVSAVYEKKRGDVYDILPDAYFYVAWCIFLFSTDAYFYLAPMHIFI